MASPPLYRSAAVTVLALVASCGGPAAAPPNILLISIDTLRADHLSCYGYERPTSPRLDALAAQGLRVERCVATTSWTLPSHMSMLTGNPISVHGIDDDRRWDLVDAAGNPLPPELKGRFVSEALNASGYRCAGFYTWKYLEDRFGFGPGFESWERLGHTFYSHPEVSPEFDRLRAAGDTAGMQALAKAHPALFDAAHNTSPEVVERSSAWLTKHVEREGDRPFFLFAHFFDVHDPYITPEPFHSMFDPDYQGPIDGMRVTSPDSPVHVNMDKRDLHNLVARYDGGIRYVDSQVGLLLDRLDELGLAENTLVIVTSDHGEEFFEHGQKTHRHQLYPESIEVPLIMRWPAGLAAGNVLGGTHGVIDIAPTITTAAGTSMGHPLRGRSLLPWPPSPLAERPYLSELLLFEDGPVPLRQFALSEGAQRASLGRARGLTPWTFTTGDGKPLQSEPGFAGLLDELRALHAQIPGRLLSDAPLSAGELRELNFLGYTGNEDGAIESKQPSLGPERLSIEGGPWPDE